MRRPAPWYLGLALLVLTAGCAGRDITVIKNEKTLGMASYAGATAGSDPLASGVTPARSIDFAFLDQVLVSYQFVSSFKAERDHAGRGGRAARPTHGHVDLSQGRGQGRHRPRLKLRRCAARPSRSRFSRRPWSSR